MDTYRNIHFEVVQIGTQITIRASLSRRNFWGKARTKYLYANNSQCADRLSLDGNFYSETPKFWELPYLSFVKDLADACQKRYESVDTAPYVVLYSTKQVDNFDQIHELTQQLIAVVKSGDDEAEKTILKQLEVLHNVRS